MLKGCCPGVTRRVITLRKSLLKQTRVRFFFDDWHFSISLSSKIFLFLSSLLIFSREFAQNLPTLNSLIPLPNMVMVVSKLWKKRENLWDRSNVMPSKLKPPRNNWSLALKKIPTTMSWKFSVLKPFRLDNPIQMLSSVNLSQNKISLYFCTLSPLSFAL